MTTKNPRVNVTFEKTAAGLLAHLAHQEHKSIAGIVRELTYEALEMREDLCLSELAKKLDKANAKTYSHNEAWE